MELNVLFFILAEDRATNSKPTCGVSSHRATAMARSVDHEAIQFHGHELLCFVS